jgi:hypothetical protein
MGTTAQEPPTLETAQLFLDSGGKGMQAYVADLKKAKYRVLTATPFPATLNREINALKSVYHAHSKIGWESLLKGRITQEWTQFIETHYANQGHKLKA